MANNISFQDYLRKTIDMSPKEADLISSHFQSGEIRKNDFLIKPDQISKYSYYLKEGVIRSYIIDLDGNEVTTRLFSAPDFFNDYLSFFSKKPSKEYYQAVTDCQVQTIDFQSVQVCFHSIPPFREWGRMMLTLNYVTLHEHMISLHTQTAEERYTNLLKHRPEIIQRVPLKYIASYLGITDSSLSRVRKKLISQGL